MKFSKPMVSREMMTKILCGNFKKDLPTLPPRQFFHVYIINKESYGSCNFRFLKNSLVQINSKLN